LLWQQIVNGISIGSIYALISMGLAMVYGIMRILHVAHAGIYTIGAYLGLYFFRLTGDLFLSTLLSMFICALIGVIVQRFVYYPLLRFPPIRSLDSRYSYVSLHWRALSSYSWSLSPVLSRARSSSFLQLGGRFYISCSGYDISLNRGHTFASMVYNL